MYYYLDETVTGINNEMKGTVFNNSFEFFQWNSIWRVNLRFMTMLNCSNAFWAAEHESQVIALKIKF